MRLYITASINKKYFANMCNICSSIDDDAYYDNESYKYLVTAYFDGRCRGVASSFQTDDFSELIDAAYDYANRGYCIIVENLETGDREFYDPDELLEDYGDATYSIRSLA